MDRARYRRGSKRIIALADAADGISSGRRGPVGQGVRHLPWGVRADAKPAQGGRCAVHARLEKPGWTVAGFNDGDWAGVRVAQFGYDHLVASEAPPVRRQEEIRPVSIFRTPNGQRVVDFGQNMTGWVRLRVRGEPGTAVT